MQNTKSPVVPIIGNGVLIWEPITAHYCTLLGSVPPLIQRISLLVSFPTKQFC